ncbi:MAG: hypothetical protein GXY85_01090 [Candidatus Brocadiaceae bacterium]|nr:hypothetical protein [Candidatus Brocadiaceae bacterium]
MPGERPAAAGGSGILAVFLGGETEGVQVLNAPDGVDLKMTADEPARVTALQLRVAEGVAAGLARTQERTQRRRARPGQPERPLRAGAGPAALLAEDVGVSARNTDDGVIVSFTSTRPEVVQALQERMPQWVDALSERARRARRTQEARRLLRDQQVAMDVQETGNGIVVTITSDDPEVAARIRDLLPEHLQAQHKPLGAAGAGPAGALDPERPRRRARVPRER